MQHDFSVNDAIWRIFLAFLHVHLHEDQDQIQRVLRNLNVQEIQQIFTTKKTQIISLLQNELSGVHGHLNWDQSTWKSSTLSHNAIYKQFTATVYVFSDSVLCLGGKCPQDPGSAREQDSISNFVSLPE